MLPFLPATSVLGGGGPSAGEKSDDDDRRRGEDDADAASSLRDSAETLAAIDARYESVGCIGRGGFGSVFLARSRASGRKVALKVMKMDTSDDDEYETFMREIDAVVALNEQADESANSNRDLNIVYFEDWHISRHFVCIVMQYYDGGTLAQEIDRRRRPGPFEPYTERRIAWYALQLCDALAYIHERGYAHHDVKAGNVMIDASAGGKLLLADFGTAIRPGEEVVGFTRSYASPELLASHDLEDYAGLRADRNDAFALGCVLYEIVMVRRLEEVTDGKQTLADFIVSSGLDAAMDAPQMSLPWLAADGRPSGSPAMIGYTSGLRNLIMNFLRPSVEERLLPGQTNRAMRTDPLSPLLAPSLVASKPPVAGAPVTLDNVQLGLLVQRGPDWSDGDADGGLDSVGGAAIGAITRLDGDGTYCDVTFPPVTGSAANDCVGRDRPRSLFPGSTAPTSPETICCRIGAGNRHELRVAPAVPEFVQFDAAAGGRSVGMRRHDGLLWLSDGDSPSNYRVGQMLNPNCIVVGVDADRGLVVVAPSDRSVPGSFPPPAPWRTDGESSSFIPPRADEDELRPPDHWQQGRGTFVRCEGMPDGREALDLFHATSGGLVRSECPVESVERIQDSWLYESYVQRSARVAAENWGLENEARAFVACDGPAATSSDLRDFQSSGRLFSAKAAVIHRKFNRRRPLAGGSRSQAMLLCRVLVGRTLEGDENNERTTSSTDGAAAPCHSELVGPDLYSCRGSCMVLPEYRITYRHRAEACTDACDDSAAEEGAAAGGRSEDKMCTICMERPVRYLMIPCGHPSICERCNTSRNRMKLRGKCPECRANFYSTAIIYGRVVSDD